MNLYERWILPSLIDLAMRQHQLCPYRAQVITAARGRILEIGVGSGLNFRFYDRAVDHVCGIDPSLALLRLAQRRRASADVGMFLVGGTAEQLPFAAASFETVVTTWTLCSIPDPARALTEIRRVLLPGGRLLFVEHGLAPEPSVARWQHRLTPCWRRVAGGCHLDRKMDDLIRSAGFDLRISDASYMPGPRPWTFFYRGEAIKRSPAPSARSGPR